ncbi:unnamed protein product [Vitrella brassicaformis CCMP3155]|uniref:Ubiquitin-like domain-containing protein n=1 Tax=Vitrella brassicaformis (strain CCMP3155) TaxID=1169540 RepID=A0A0G4EEG0_VITBC|nr:unnamed protein product [Vitrella brassicaformis CCMP3155]|eukprot:CEL93947.1 unnamed protein product [Vitrella brassicaformis CCMP3155]
MDNFLKFFTCQVCPTCRVALPPARERKFSVDLLNAALSVEGVTEREREKIAEGAPAKFRQESTVIALFVKNLKGATMCFDIRPSATVRKLKEMVKDREGIEIAHQRLIYAGKQLDDNDKTLRDYGIQKNDTVHLVLRLRGG